MPIYNFKCRKCGMMFEEIVHVDREFAMCKCGHTADKIFTPTRFVPFKPYVEYNFGDEPVEITSKAQLERELKSRGLFMDNSPQRNSLSKRKRAQLEKKAKEFTERFPDSPSFQKISGG